MTKEKAKFKIRKSKYPEELFVQATQSGGYLQAYRSPVTALNELTSDEDESITLAVYQLIGVRRYKASAQLVESDEVEEE